MVTIKKDGAEGQYLRVRNTTKQELASLQDKINNGWSYCPKWEWKNAIRDRGKDS